MIDHYYMIELNDYWFDSPCFWPLIWRRRSLRATEPFATGPSTTAAQRHRDATTTYYNNNNSLNSFKCIRKINFNFF